jgi:formate hydrogenlyase transcriptional activator
MEPSRLQDRLDLLLTLTNRMVSSLDLRDVMREMTASVRRILDCDAVGVTLPMPEEDQLRVYAVDLPDGKGVVFENLVAPTSANPLMQEVLRTGQSACACGDDLKDRDPYAAAEGLWGVMQIPMSSHGRILGILSVGRRVAKRFSEDELQFANLFAGQGAIALENAMAFQRIQDLNAQLAQEKLYLEDEIRTQSNFDEIVGKSTALRAVLRQVETVAPTGSTVLIQGETGTGKELIARAIHNRGSRRSKAFVKLNCAAIPTGLLESELFGHEKGAFTGAIAQRIGRFELGNGGSIFLDEIGEIPLELQPKLLRVIQEGEFERLGSGHTLRTDARLIAATNRDLEAMADDQKFRPDLYYRLNVFPIRAPALRERAEDIPLLVRHFAQQFSRRMGKTIETIPSETLATLARYHWPGNIRELQNIVERAVIVSNGPVLKVALGDLKIHKPAAPSNGASSNGGSNGDIRGVLEATERRQILQALEQCKWVVAGPNGAAGRLGMKRSTLQARMRKLGIQVARSLN